jgi:hypothetical protein
MKIRILNDYQYEGYEEFGEPIAIGTVIEDAELYDTPWWVSETEDDVDQGKSAVYAHPVTGEDWISYPGAFEILEA